jgi:hypothetical protein
MALRHLLGVAEIDLGAGGARRTEGEPLTIAPTGLMRS